MCRHYRELPQGSPGPTIELQMSPYRHDGYTQRHLLLGGVQRLRRLYESDLFFTQKRNDSDDAFGVMRVSGDGVQDHLP